MPSCERIAPQYFHNRDARLYTEQCVFELTQKKSYSNYVSHVEYNERLYLTWLIAPLGLVIAFYFHLFCMLGSDGIWMEPSSQEGYIGHNSSLMPIATGILLLYVAPCVILAPFVGFHEPISRQHALAMVVMFTYVNLALVSYGGSLLNRPPYLTTTPPLQWFKATTAEARGLLVTAFKRVLPLEGAIVAGWLIFEWRRVYWRSAWHVPLPLLTIPIFVGLFACVWFHAANVFLSLIFPLDGSNGVDIMTALPSAFALLCNDATNLFGSSSFPAVFADAVQQHHAWWSVMTVSLTYFLSVLLLPLLRFIFRLFHAILPTHPTTWGLTLILCVAGAVVLLQRDDAKLCHVSGLLNTALLLFFKGFVTA